MNKKGLVVASQEELKIQRDKSSNNQKEELGWLQNVALSKIQ